MDKNTLADPGGAAGAPPPQRDPILSFLHMFSLKSACVGSWRPPPPTGNPGSATGIYIEEKNSLYQDKLTTDKGLTVGYSIPDEIPTTCFQLCELV